MSDYRLILGDCKDVLATMGADSVDAIVADAPYGIQFMGRKWDYDVPSVETFEAALRVLKDGGRMLCFAGARTAHRMTVNIEDAGFVIEDVVMFLHGSGFPKHSSKLKPAYEPIVVARKGSVADLNIDATRIEASGPSPSIARRKANVDLNASQFRASYNISEESYRRERPGEQLGRWPANVVLSHHEECREVGTKRVRSGNPGNKVVEGDNTTPTTYRGGYKRRSLVGHADPDGTETVPAFDCHPDCPVRLLDEQSGAAGGKDRRGFMGGRRPGGFGGVGANSGDAAPCGLLYDDSGGASRFFYTSKASRAERERGLEGMARKPGGSTAKGFTDDVAAGQDRNRPVANNHPTVKPLDLMQWLVRLVTQPGDVVLDPFMGSGTTGMACVAEGRRFIGIERDADYLSIAERRIASVQPSLFSPTPKDGEA